MVFMVCGYCKIRCSGSSNSGGSFICDCNSGCCFCRKCMLSRIECGGPVWPALRAMPYLLLATLLIFHPAPARSAWIDVQVSADSDDAEERVSSGNMNLGSSDLELVDEGGSAGNRQLVGMRFLNVEVANGATILEAYLEFETDETDSGASSLTIRGQDADNPGTFTGGNSNISNRTTTTASTNWNNLPAWNTTSEHHISPDISAVVQEIVDRGGWSSGNAMVYVVNGSGERTAESHNGEPDAAAILRIKYDGRRASPGSNICFAVADGGNELVTVDTTNGNETLIGGTETPDGDYGTAVEGIAYDSLEGDLYGSDQDILGRLDQSTGQFYRLTEFFGTGSGANGNIDLDAVQGLAFERGTSNTVLYAMHRVGSTNYLFLADHETGAHIDNAFDTDGNGSGDADYITITGIGQIDDLAIDPTDQTIYVISGGNALYTLNRTNSSSTWTTNSIGTVTRTEGGTAPTDIEGLGFDDSGQLFGSTGNSGAAAQRNRLWSIDKSNADASDVGALTEGTDYEALACALSASTRASVGGLRAYASAVKGTIVEWETTSERGTLGFHLERKDAGTGKYRRVNKRLLPGLLHARNGGLYRYGDLDVRAGEAVTYRLVEMEAAGSRRIHGPFPVTIAATPFESDGQPSDAFAGFAGVGEPGERAELFEDPSNPGPDTASTTPAFERTERALSALHQARLAAKRDARASAKRDRERRKGPRAKIHVAATGLHRLDAQAIADALGEPVSRVRSLIGRDRLRLTSAGKAVATLAPEDASALFFYGQAPESIYAAENVYWLAEGKGVAMGTRRGGFPAPVAGQRFEHTARAEGNRYSITHLLDDPDDDYWMWDFRYENLQFPMYQDVFDLPTPGRVEDAPARLTVRLHGGSDARHAATLVLNGVTLGTTTFEGLAPHTAEFELEGSLVNDGSNEIRLLGSASGVPGEPSTFYLNDLAITYSRRHVAQDESLLFSRGRNRVVSVSGFASNEVEVLDVSKPTRPRRITELTLDGDDGDWRVSFRAGRKSSMHLALDLASARTPDAMYADRPSKLARRKHRVDYLVITSSDMVETAQRLADYRAGTQALRAMVVDIEDVYDEFNHGVPHPDALWRFLRHAHQKWRVGPRYVVLAGEGSFDYKDYLGHGDSIIPTLLTPTPDGLFPSDNLFADVEGNDWIPEMAIGRLPVIDAAELDRVIDKLVGYERSGGDWEKRATLAADIPDLGGDFPRASEAIAARLPLDYAIERIHLDEMTPGEARAAMLAGIHAGRAFINFFGHSGFTSLGNASLLTSFDGPSLGNADRLPVLTAFTCLAGQFGFPGQEALGEAMVVSQGGAVAVWAPSGLSVNPLARRLGEGFYRATFDDGELVLGEAVMKAQAYFAGNRRDRYLLDIYNLIGDPATVMK